MNGLSAAESALVEEVRSVTRDRLVPLVEVGEEGRVNRPLLAEMGRAGLLRRLFGGEPDEDDIPF